MPRPPEPAVDLVAAADPVAAFASAHEQGRPVRLRTSGGTEVVRSTASWADSFGAFGDLAGVGPGSRVWVPGPLSASMNLFARVHAAYAGAVTLTDAAGADGAGWATHAALTPAALARLLDRGAPAGLVVVAAGDRLPRALHDRATAAGLVVHHYYGAAELSFVGWGRHAEDLRPFPGVEVEERDGELWARSPYLCLTSDGPLRRSPDGYATVGDRGRLGGGRIVVDGRPDAVTTAGATVRVADVEAALRPLARGDLVVTGTPHAELGAVLTAVLTEPEDRAVLTRAARDRLPAEARPRRWLHRAVLPLTDAGKVDRAAVARLAAASVPPGDAS